jgi:HEPN domain-containing protein
MLALAEEDVAAARVLSREKNRYAAYHCQQASEKLVKAILLARNIESGVEHRLDVLVEKIPESDPWKTVLRPLDIYTPYATTFRYPAPAGGYPRPRPRGDPGRCRADRGVDRKGPCRIDLSETWR